MDRLIAWATLPLLPAAAAVVALHPRLRIDAAERLGWRVPPVQPGAIWLHAASVGEVRAAAALLPLLPRPVLLTADTDTGAAQARRLALRHPGVVAGACPLDHGLTLAPLWAEARPRAVLFVEGTFWPSLAWRARRAGVPVVRVGAKAGSRTRRAAPWLRWLWHPTDAVLARDASEAAFFERVQAAPVQVLGNPKTLAQAPRAVLRFARPPLVACSTRPGDEAAVLRAVFTLPSPPPVLLAPRHLERVPEVLALCAEQHRETRLRSELLGAVVAAEVEVVVLDTLGELAGCLPGAAVAFVGGTFDPRIGGHSPHEAAAAGVPVVAGPHQQAQGSAFREVGATVVAEPEELGAALQRVLQATGERSSPSLRRMDAARAGDALRAWIGSPAPEASPRPWAAPLAAVYGAVSEVRNAAYERQLLPVRRVGVPVVSVGSTNARSPGRTSTVAAVVGVLQGRGHRVGVATRGYRRTKGGRAVHLSTRHRDAAHLGDEGALLAATGAVVAAGPDRVACAEALVAAGVSVVVADDGLQHRRLHRDLEVVVVDARFVRARGLLPMGERRESGAVPARADVVVVHHADASFEVQVGDPVRRRPGAWCSERGRQPAPTGPVVAFCGIGRPADFLASLTMEVAEFVALPDHAPITQEMALQLLRTAGERPLVCTHKDAVRCPPSLRSRALWRDIEVQLPAELRRRLEGL
ncbi:MAG: tetraacyldisaccharide 4'-kinase [Myxococcales bacterium]|nr:tetraacyldisaccharide 4'-kinase [Myxococcales bacterium]